MMYGRGFERFGDGFNGCFGYNSGFFGGFGMMIGMTALLVIGILLIVFFIKKSRHQQSNNAALETLKMRYIQGEITEEEFLAKKKIINS